MYDISLSLTDKVRWRVFTSTLLLGLTLAPITAHAEWYGGANFGQTKVKNSTFCSDLASVLDPGYSCGVDEKNGWRMYGGLQFMDNLAVEVGYVDLGTFTTKVNGSASGAPVTSNTDFKAKGYNLALVGILPVTKELSVIGRVGVFRWTAKVSGTATSGAVTVSNSAKATKAGNTPNNIGIGVNYNLTKSVGLRAEWERFTDVGEKDITDITNVYLLSLGLVYTFQ